MFHKTNEKNNSAESSLPTPQQLLFELTNLISEKFRLKQSAKARFNSSIPGKVSIVLLNDDSSATNRIIGFIKVHGGQNELEIEVKEGSYSTNSISTLDIARVREIIDGLKLLTIPHDEQPRRHLLAGC